MKKARSIRLVLANVENRTRTDPAFCGSDAVHPGDSTDGKGVYHVNAVDEVTQWEIAAAAPRISEALEPALTAVLAQFPFVIHGFHPDNRSEFINQTVAKVLNELMIEQTNPGRPYPAVLHGPTSTPT